MKENKLKQKDLADILGFTKGTISKILNYQNGLSKETIRKLSKYFKLQQELFNQENITIRHNKKGVLPLF